MISEILWCFLSSKLQKIVLINLPVFYTKLSARYSVAVLKRKPGELFMLSSKFVPQKRVVSFPEVILDEFSEWEFKIVRQQWCYCCPFPCYFRNRTTNLGLESHIHFLLSFSWGRLLSRSYPAPGCTCWCCSTFHKPAFTAVGRGLQVLNSPRGCPTG